MNENPYTAPEASPDSIKDAALAKWRKIRNQLLWITPALFMAAHWVREIAISRMNAMDSNYIVGETVYYSVLIPGIITVALLFATIISVITLLVSFARISRLQDSPSS